MYDELLMPDDYWGPVEKKDQPPLGSRSLFAPNYRLEGVAIRVHGSNLELLFHTGGWMRRFGLFVVDCRKWPGEHVLVVVPGCAGALIASMLVHRRWHPELGIED